MSIEPDLLVSHVLDAVIGLDDPGDCQGGT